MTHTVSTTPTVSTSELATLGPVHLHVTDAERALAFWRDLLGLRMRDGDAGTLILGTERDPLLVLHPGARSRVASGSAGLYHLAIHLPDEREFARVLARLIARRARISPTDHVGSKSIYLSDPDGIGLELTLETPERMREGRVTIDGLPEIIDVDGRRRSGRDPLDVDEALSALGDGDITAPVVDGAKIGHVHLSVGDLQAARAFYRDQLGFIAGAHLPTVGMADLGAGGVFTHRIALNTWQGLGVSQPPNATAGLRYFTIQYGTLARRAATLTRLPDAVSYEGGTLVRDPSGNAILLAG